VPGKKVPLLIQFLVRLFFNLFLTPYIRSKKGHVRQFREKSCINKIADAGRTLPIKTKND